MNRQLISKVINVVLITIIMILLPLMAVGLSFQKRKLAPKAHLSYLIPGYSISAQEYTDKIELLGSGNYVTVFATFHKDCKEINGEVWTPNGINVATLSGTPEKIYIQFYMEGSPLTNRFSEEIIIITRCFKQDPSIKIASAPKNKWEFQPTKP